MLLWSWRDIINHPIEVPDNCVPGSVELKEVKLQYESHVYKKYIYIILKFAESWPYHASYTMLT